MKFTEWIWVTYKVSGAPILVHKIMHICRTGERFLSCTSFSSALDSNVVGVSASRVFIKYYICVVCS